LPNQAQGFIVVSVVAITRLHDIFLAWFGDVVDILSSSDIGFALWNFRGDFGILDSGRKDVDYEDWHGHKLDRKLLDLIRKA